MGHAQLIKILIINKVRIAELHTVIYSLPNTETLMFPSFILMTANLKRKRKWHKIKLLKKFFHKFR